MTTNWTCEQTESRLIDYLDGLLLPVELAAFNTHAPTCERCAPLVASVSDLLINLHALPELDTPPRLVYNILDKTLGPRETVTGWAAVLAWFRGMNPQRIAYGGVSFCAMFLMIASFTSFNWKKPRVADLSPVNVYRGADRQAHLVYARSTKFVSDLRVVYEIQSRLQREDQLPNNQDSTTPQTSPDKNPGSTDGSAPASPKQQNRANDLASHSLVLAAACPVCSEGRIQ